MPEGLLLVAYALFDLVLLTALGSGPTMLVARRRPELVVLAPVIGLALAAGVLTTTATIVSMRVAAFAVLLPLTVVSLAWAWRSRPRGALSSAREVWRRFGAPLSLSALAMGLAALPGIVRGTLGPVSLFIFDGWGYIQADLWLQENRVGAAPPCCVPNPDLSLNTGYGFTTGAQRIGVSVVNASLTSLLGTSPDRTHLAFLVALAAMVPLVVWALARALGASNFGAAFGACFGLSPAILLLVADSTLANLAGIVLAPSALFLLALGLRAGDYSATGAGAILAAGLVCVFPEFLLPIVLAAAAGVALLLVADRPALCAAARRLPTQGGVIILALVAVAPVGLLRAADYLASRQGDGAWADGLPMRWLTFENGGAWTFGVVHLYELQRWAISGDARRIVAIGLPVVLAAILVVGLARAGWRRAAFVALPVVTAIVAGLWAYRSYQNGGCEYCLWKALTFMLPFVGIGLGVAVTHLLPATRERSWRPWVSRSAIGVAALAAIAALGRSDAELIRAVVESPAVVSTPLREVGDTAGDLPSGSAILLEGADASGAEKYSVPAFYYLARGGGRRIVFDAGGVGTQYLMSPRPPEAYYSPDYAYVFTGFPGLKSGRTVVAQSGSYALERRASVDVAVARTGYAQDPAEGRGAIPWVTVPFELWVASPKAAVTSLRIGLQRPTGSSATLRLFDADGLPVPTAAVGNELCARVQLNAGRTTLRAEPVLPVPPPPLVRPTESDPLPPPPKALGLDSLRTGGATCPPVPPGAAFGEGWQPEELDPTVGVFRWMGTQSVVAVTSTVDDRRPRVRMAFQARTLTTTQRIRVALGPRIVKTLTISGPHWQPIVIDVPAGSGAALLRLTAAPGAEPASVVSPGDPRLLAVAFTRPRVTRLP